jgi:asparagine synthase (glutamine-hydrolysing)
MCGIAGVVSVQGNIQSAVVERMRDAMRHRGPDDAGLRINRTGQVALAHRRLSIIDLSPLGHQPMCNEDESIWIAFNGEIYNFPELRASLLAKGHRFRSHTDTEVIIHLYEDFGEECVQHLRGMFAFAIWDERRSELFLARDRFGIKPLYYYAEAGEFYFASELKGVMANPRVPRKVDLSSVYDFLSYRYVPTPKSIYQNVKKLPPAHTMTVTLGQADVTVRTRRYWDLCFKNDQPGPTVEELTRQLAEAVDLHLIGDVPLGVLLSGGVDSSLVTGLMSQVLGRKAETFTVGFDVEKKSEAPYARRVAELFGTDHHEITSSLTDLDNSLRWVVDAYDEPFGDGSALPTHLVSELARRSVTVALAGDGGDELCGGYSWYARWQELRGYDKYLPQGLRTLLQGAAPGAWKVRNFGRTFLLDPLEQYLRLVGAYTRYEKQQLLAPAFLREFRDYDDVWQLRDFWREDLDPLSRLQYLDVNTYLPDDILTKVDRASMSVSLELRPPLLDHKVAEMLAAIPARERVRDKVAKLPLKQMLRQWLPADLIDRPKQGFSVPWGVWLAPAQVRQRLQGGALVQAGILDQEVVGTIHDKYLSGSKAWTLLVLEEWFRVNQP